MEDRVFVCVGKYDSSDTDAYWVMTLNERFDEVTMWDCIKHEQVTLPGRIRETENLKAYLLPGELTPKEREEKIRMAKWRER